MSLLVVLYFLVIIYLLYIGIFVFKKDRDLSGLYFLIFSILLGLWLLFYFLSYFTTLDIELLLIYSKLTYSLSIIGLYSFLLFVINFGKRNIHFVTRSNIFIFIIFILLFYLYNFTSLFIDGMYFDAIKNHHYEIEGKLYFVHDLLSFIFIPLFVLISYYKLKTLTYIKKIRLQYVLLGVFVLFFLAILFLLVLPTFGIRIFEKEIVLLVLPFLLAQHYSLNKYYFIDIKIGFGKVFIFFMSIFWVILIVNLIRIYYLNLGNLFTSFWGVTKDFGVVDLILGILLYIIIYHKLSDIFLGNNNFKSFETNINSIKTKISYISEINHLNIYLNKQFFKLFKIKYVNIKLFNKFDTYLELYKYFTKDCSRLIFMNDIVFIEENKYKFDLNKLQKEINNNVYLIFPLFNNKNELIGILEIGERSFKEYFLSQEIKIIQDFSKFIVGHLKYIEIYSKINDLNINLDKKVDEKTIEYNLLLNKQSEFISFASHEIKSPIGSSIFQLDCILDDIEEGDMTVESIYKELKSLNNTLLKVGDLTNKIFSVQKFDLDKVMLYKQKINISLYLNDILSLFIKLNKNLKLIKNIENKKIFLNIDKIQFTQVIDNLLNNALKFANSKNPKIIFTVKDIGKNILISIEDNGNGFKYFDNKMIFEKYNSGNTSSVGIGLGLYLCKNIIEMHGGTISAENSKELGGAKFIILLAK